ncbi:MAG: hypothetical protein ACREQ9_10250 [Candidatus Binatia bacterium]
MAILYLAVLYKQQHGALSFDLLKLYELSIPSGAQLWLFAAFALAFPGSRSRSRAAGSCRSGSSQPDTTESFARFKRFRRPRRRPY